MKSLKNINLVLKKRSQSQRIKKIGKITSLISVSIIIIFVIAYVASFLTLTYLTAKYKNAQNQISDLTTKINQNQEVEGIFLASSLKLASIKEITASQIHYPSLLKEIYGLPNDGVVFKSFSISPNGLVTIEMTASSSGVLNNLVNTLSDKDEIENKFKGIMTSSIKRGNEGTFSLGVNFNIQRDKFND